MVRVSKAQNRAALQAKGIPRKSWSKLEFCARNDLSEGLYDTLQKRGLGPDETEVLDRTIITVEAEERWLRRMRKRKPAKADAAEA